MRVLIVEDDPTFLSLLERNFKERGTGVEVAVASRLADGLERCLAFRPTVVLLDLGLHDSQSDHTAESVHLFTGAPPPAVVVLTGSERTELVTRCFKDGADSYISKAAVAGRFDFLLTTILNASLRREHQPGYCRKS